MVCALCSKEIEAASAAVQDAMEQKHKQAREQHLQELVALHASHRQLREETKALQVCRRFPFCLIHAMDNSGCSDE
jgi:hypothetical protein